MSKRQPPNFNRARIAWVFVIGTAVLALAFSSVVTAQTKVETLSAPDKITQRYWEILRRSPKPGTAFDQWYRGHVDRGEVQALTASLKQQADASTVDPSIQTLYGLVLRRQGELELAIGAFRRAATDGGYYPQWLLGQTLHQAQDFTASRKALSAAVARSVEANVPRPELLSVYRDLGQAQVLSGNPDAAVETWSKLGELFPADRHVQMQIGSWLRNANRLNEALAVWKRVEQLTSEPYGNLEARLTMSGIYSELNDRAAAVAILDRALDAAKPGSSLDRDIRSRLATAHSDDTDALIGFLMKRVETHPEEIGSTVQLSEALNTSARYDEAIALLQSAVKRAPKQTNVRETLIATMRQTAQFESAYRQADVLVRQNPQDVKFLELAGQLRLDAAAHPTPMPVVQEVLRLWNRIPSVRPDDASLAIRTADLFARSAGLNAFITTTFSPQALRQRFGLSPFAKAAERWYRQAVEVAADPVSYSEYLAQFLRDTGRTPEAIAVIDRQIPTDATGEQWYQVAQIFRRLGFQEQALTAAETAVATSPDNLIYRELCVKICRATKQYEKAIKYLDAILAQLEKPREIVGALQTRVEMLLESGLLAREERRLGDRVRANPTWQDLWQLGLVHESRNDERHARPYLEQALKQLPNEPALIATSAEVDVVSGDVTSGIRKYQHLAEIEPHLRSAHYRRVVELHLGQSDQVKARRAAELLFSVPANRANDFLDRAAIAKMLEDADTESQMLTRAVQIEPRNVEARVTLGQNLSEKGKHAEAIENYWRAFELVESVNEKGRLIRTMHDVDEDLFARRIMPRLQTTQEAAAKGRETELSLADAYVAAGDLARASSVLNGLLQDDEFDPLALQRIADVEMRRDRPLVAAEHLEKLADVSDSEIVWRQLLKAYESGGQTDQCIQAATRLANDFGATTVFSDLVDRVPVDDVQRAMAFGTAGLDLNPADWRLRIRMAILLQDDHQRMEALSSALRSCLADPRLVEFAEKQVELTGNLSTAKAPRDLGNATLSHHQIRMVLNSTFPVFQEFNNARASAYRYIRQQQAVRRSRQLQGRNASRVVRSNAGKFIPTNPYSGAVYCYQILAKEFGDDIARRQTSEYPVAEYPVTGERQAEWVRLRIRIVAAAAAEELWANLDLLERYAEMRPNDLLPHIAKFYESIHDTALDEIAAANLRSIDASHEWIEKRYPALAQELSGQYAQQLVTAKRFERAARLLSEQVDKAQSVKALVQLAPTCLQVDSPAFRESFLTRALELSKTPDTIPEDIGEVLLVAFNEPFRTYKPTEWVAVLALLENYLKSPVQYGHSRRVTSTTTFQSTRATRTHRSQQWTAALKDPTLSTDQKRAIAQAIQRQTLSANVRRGSTTNPSTRRSRNGRRGSTDKIMMSNNPHLSHHQREILSRAIEQANNSGDERMVLDWLSEKAAAPSATVTQRVAHPYALWLANQCEAAADGFAALSSDFPQDVNLRLLAAAAAFEVNNLDRSFIMLSDKSLRGSRVESDTILLRSQVNSSLARLTDYDVGLRCLIAAMEHQTVPYLYPFFSRQNQHVASTTLPVQGHVDDRRMSEAWRLSGKPFQSAVILGILDHAWQLDNGVVTRERTANAASPPSQTTNLQWIQRLVETNLTLHPNDQELTTLQILLQLRNGEYEKAQSRIAHLQRSHSVEHWTSATTAELASALCRIPSTVELGYELASAYIIGNVSRGAGQRGNALLKRVTHLIADQRKLEEHKVGARFWDAYFQALEQRCATLPAIERSDVVTESINAIYEASHDTIPTALVRIVEFTRGPIGDQVSASKLGPILYSTIRSANLHWLSPERRVALDALIDLTFPNGLHGRCEMWNWYQFPNADSELLRYSLGDPILRIAAATEQLSALQQQLEKSPHVDDPQIVALRLEIAKLNNDVTTLIPLGAATNKRTGIPYPPVWSVSLIEQIDPSLRTIGTVIRRSGKVTLRVTEKTIECTTLELPSAPFQLTGINLEIASDTVRGSRGNQETSVRPDRARPMRFNSLGIGRLRHLEILELTNVRIADDELAAIVRQPIVKLRLDGSDISDEGLRQLAQMKTLKHLSVRHTRVTAAALAELRASLPNCEILPSE